MTITCSNCGRITQKKIGIHKYTESGLDNVYLENIPFYECTCGVSYPSIFRLSTLNDLIALTLTEKPSLLNGNEIKFLRKNMRAPSGLFANMLGVGKTTLSKWENGLQNHSEGHDRLIRAVYMIQKGIKQSDQLKIQKYLNGISLKKSNSEYLIIAERTQDGYQVRYTYVPESQSKISPSDSIEVSGPWKSWNVVTNGVFLGATAFAGTEQTRIRRDLISVFTGNVLPSEGTEPYATETTKI